MAEKKKKEKIRYVDDGRTLADMSGVSAGPRLGRDPYRQSPKFKDAWTTYWTAVKMMFLPMLAVIGALVVIYLILYLLVK